MKTLRPISLILALALLLSMIPLQAGAAELNKSSADIGGNAPEIMGESSVGAILGEAMEQNEQTDNTSEGISDVTVNGRTATVTLLHTTDCMVVVGIYDEAGETLLQTAQQRGIAADDETAVVTFDSDLPEYFVLRAFILDENCAPLGKQFETDRYTSAYKEFLEKTTADFPEEDVLNFDGSTSNNFAVFDSAVKEISVDGKNTPTIGENGYTFTGADESLLALAEGDIFTFDNNGEPEIVKVGSVSVSGDTVTITPADVQMEEVFDYVKIDVTADEAALDMSNADEGVSYAPQDDGSVGAGAEYELLRHFTLNVERANIEGELDLTSTLRFKLYYSGGILETELTDEVSGELDVSVGVKYEGAFRLCKLHFPTPVAGLMIAVEVEFTPEVSAKFNGKVEFKQKVGCAYSSKSGFRNLSEKPKLDAEVNFEGTIFIGFALTPSVEALFGVVELGLECKLGAEGTGTRVLTTTDTKESDHLCRWCIDGTINGKAEISVELETGFWKKWKHTLSVKLIDWEKKLFDFYYSANNGFGKGECPNRKEPEHNDPEPYTGKFPENSGVAENFDASAYCYADYADYSNYITTYTYINGRGDFDFYEYKDALIPFTSNSYDWCTSDWYKDYGYYNLLYWGQGYYKNIVYINGFDAVNYCALMPPLCNDEMVIITGPTKCVNLYGGYFNCGYINPELVSLPDSVTAVRNSKYNEDYYLSYSNTDIPCYINDINVSFPPSIKHIEGYNNRPYPNGKYDDYDYNAYASIKSVTFPPSTEYVDGFNENPITSLTLPQPDTTLTIKGFYRCPIEELIIPPNVSIIDCDINDYLLGLVKCKSFTNLKNVTLQSDMTKLNGRDMLEDVYFDEPLTAVIDDCCRDCPNLKTISFAPTVTSIGKNAFNGTGLESVTIPSTVKKISEGAFANCPDLEEVIIEDGVMEIDKNAFANCPNLKRVIVPSSVVILDHRAFNDCTPVVVIDYSGTARDWMNIIGEYELNNNKLTERKMSELTAVSPIYKNCIICCGTKNRKGGESVGASADDCYPGTEYLIAVEDAENGMLNGQITALYQVSADGNGSVNIPDNIATGESEYLNLYGACRHPSTHLTENNRNICNVCGARLPAIIDRGMLPDDPGIAVGDANLDGKLDIRDVTAIQRHVAEFKILTGDAFLAADANGDGAVTIEDATYLQMYFAEYGVVLG